MSKKPFIPACVVVFWSLCLVSSLCVAQRPAPVGTDEILALLRAGVASDDVATLLTRRGAPSAVTEDDLRSVRAAGGSTVLLKALAHRLAAHTELRNLAKSHDTWSHSGAGISFIYPRGWIVSPTIEGDRSLVTIQRDAAGPRSWFRTPRMFVWLQRGTPFPKASQPELAGKVARLVSSRLESAGMEPRELAAGLGRLAGESCPEHHLTATVPHVSFDGSLLLRTRVLDDGTVVTIGYSCSQGDEESVRALFSDFADALSVARR